MRTDGAILSHADYNQLFSAITCEDQPVEILHLADLYVPTGKIVTTDPLVVPDLLPLARSIPPGVYPVTLVIVDKGRGGERVAVARLQVSSSKAVRWELALREGEDFQSIPEGADFTGFPVDAGLGAFYDVETSRFYNEFLDKFHIQNPVGNIYDDFFAERFLQNSRRPEDPAYPGDWLNFHLPNHPKHNVAMFQSGWGDGVYPSYWGLDEAGSITDLVIDFHVVLLPPE